MSKSAEQWKLRAALARVVAEGTPSERAKALDALMVLDSPARPALRVNHARPGETASVAAAKQYLAHVNTKEAQEAAAARAHFAKVLGEDRKVEPGLRFMTKAEAAKRLRELQGEREMTPEEIARFNFLAAGLAAAE